MKRDLLYLQKKYGYLKQYTDLEIRIIYVMNKTDYQTKSKIKQLLFETFGNSQNSSWNISFERLKEIGIITSLEIKDKNSKNISGYKLSSYI